MALNIKDPDTDRLARDLASATGETITAAVATALRERLERVRGASAGPRLAEELLLIGRRCAALPVSDARSADEILGYGADGSSS
jgi:antitoxin VapB